MPRALVLALVLLLATLSNAVATPDWHDEWPDGTHPVATLQLAWAERANATMTERRESHARTDLQDLETAHRGVVTAVERSGVLAFSATYAYFLASDDMLAARGEVFAGRNASFYLADGRDGCRDGSSCALFLERSDAARDAAAAEVADARADVDRAAVERVTGAHGIEALVVAYHALAEAEASLAGYEEARRRLVSLPSYDPDSSVYRRMLVAAYTAPAAALHHARLVEELADAAVAADGYGPRVDADHLRERQAWLAERLRGTRPFAGEGPRLMETARAEAENGTYPAAVAAVLRYRATYELDRLLFGGVADGSRERLVALLRTRVNEGVLAFETAEETGFTGILLIGAVAEATHQLRGASGSEHSLALSNAMLFATMETYALLLDPLLATAETPPVVPEGGDERAVAPPITPLAAASLAAGSLVLIGLAAVLLRRKT